MAFSPLNVSAADSGNSSEKDALARPNVQLARDENKNSSRWTVARAACRAPIPRSIPARDRSASIIRGLSGFGRVNTMVDGITQKLLRHRRATQRWGIAHQPVRGADRS
ncbi:hypothetical protein M8494_03150 [Serratia ureilytica]